MSEELGQILRQMREKKGYSIEDIQEITKIRSRYIQAIEEGKLGELPGNFYAKAFIRSYGEVVGLDTDKIEEYQNEIPDHEIDELPSRTAHSLAKPPSKVGRYLKLSSIYVLVLIVLLLVYMLIVSTVPNDTNDTADLENSRLETSEKPVENNQKQQATPPVQQNQNVQQDETTKSATEVTKVNTTSYKNRSKDLYEVVQATDNNIEIQLNFNDSCWFEIRKGGPRGKLIVMDTLGKGQSTEKILLDDQELWIHLGNASGVQLYVNDEIIDAGNEPGPKYISIQKKK